MNALLQEKDDDELRKDKRKIIFSFPSASIVFPLSLCHAYTYRTLKKLPEREILLWTGEIFFILFEITAVSSTRFVTVPEKVNNSIRPVICDFPVFLQPVAASQK